jgi:hypothetical protein
LLLDFKEKLHFSLRLQSKLNYKTDSNGLQSYYPFSIYPALHPILRRCSSARKLDDGDQVFAPSFCLSCSYNAPQKDLTDVGEMSPLGQGVPAQIRLDYSSRTPWRTDKAFEVETVDAATRIATKFGSRDTRA